jgi:hypothetical protein
MTKKELRYVSMTNSFLAGLGKDVEVIHDGA